MTRTVSPRRAVLILCVVVLVAAAAFGGWLVYYRLTYRTFVWWRPPPTINYCDRDYKRSGSVADFPAAGRTTKPACTCELVAVNWPVPTVVVGP